ncbi:MAG: hypothetical protein NVSMB8_12390 [Candidatus Limnocylindrales bacterium]
MTDDKAPGRCADCGEDAYIQMAGDDDFVCAHCFAGRATRRRMPTALPELPDTPVKRAS